MKRIIVILLLVSLCAVTKAQVSIGLRLAPAIAMSQVSTSDKFGEWVKSDGSTFKGSIGPVADFSLSPHLALSTGLWYTVKATSIAFRLPPEINKGFSSTPFPNNLHVYNLHYLQLPLTLKIRTGESAKGMRFYVQAGGTLDRKIAEQATNKDKNYLYQVSEQVNEGKDVFKSWDVGAYVGAGSEWKINDKQVIFTGISYNWGFIKQLQEDIIYNPGTEPLNRSMDIRFSLLSLELGIKF